MPTNPYPINTKCNNSLNNILNKKKEKITMCEYISWIEFNDQVLFLTNKQIEETRDKLIKWNPDQRWAAIKLINDQYSAARKPIDDQYWAAIKPIDDQYSAAIKLILKNKANRKAIWK